MNFLQLCQAVKQECGIPGTLSTVVGQSGELKRVVDWTARAYNTICTSRDDWKFLRSAFTFSTVSGDNEYEITDCVDTRGHSGGLIGFQRWWEDTLRIYRQSVGVATEMYLQYWPWEDFRNFYLIRSQPLSTPLNFTIRPDDDAILLGPSPNDIYVVSGEFQITAPLLTTNTEEPLIPPQYHDCIMWKAREYYGDYEESAAVIATARKNFKPLFNALTRIERPTVRVAGPLA